MSLTTAQQVRQKIADLPRLADNVYYGDGYASSFLLPHSNIVSGSVFVQITTPTTGWSATGATFNPTGAVAMATPISANSAFRTTYVHSLFSDADIDSFVEVGGNVNGAAIEALHALMFDAAKRAKWASPDGTQYDDVAAADYLWKAYSAIRSEQEREASVEGGMQGWGLNQGDY